MKTIEELIQQLKLFSAELIELQPPIDEGNIIALEERLSIRLPNDYRAFLRFHNGLRLMGTSVYGITTTSDPHSLEGAYLFEHYEVENPMPEYVVPFSPDGEGNHYCFDLRTCHQESCEVIFWQHDLTYTEEYKPEVVHSSFAAWVKEVIIDWTLEEYDYNGNEK